MSQFIDVNNVFYSIQGEGKYIGEPAIFVRLSGCVKPLCSFCDEPSAQKKGLSYTTSQLLHFIQEYGCKYVIFTGGEPVLQADKLEELLDWFDQHAYVVGWETSLKAYSDVFACRPFDRVTVCPKYLNGHWLLHKRWKDTWGRVNAVNRAFSDVSWKFLINDWADYNLCKDFMKCYCISSEDVWLMPYGADRETVTESTKRVIEIAKFTGYKMTPRLHILIYDRQKGV